MMTKIEPHDVIAVGDIHGCFDLLKQLVRYVRGSQCVLVFLGDIVDRGDQDLECLALVRHMTQEPEHYGISAAHCLMGNHESLLQDAIELGGVSLVHWVSNGGNYLLVEHFAGFMDWVSSLPTVIYDTDTIFVHAGLVPGESPEESISKGRENSLFWIRNPFLTMGPCLERWTTDIKRVVHGHTITMDQEGYLTGEPEVSRKGDRIGIDTGAFCSNVLTAFNNTKNYFLSIEHDYISESPLTRYQRSAPPKQKQLA